MHGTPTSIGIIAHVAGPPRWVAGAPCLPLRLVGGSASVDGPLAGRYFLARCAAEVDGERTDWTLCLRRPLYAVQKRQDEWLLHLPPDDDPGHAWLRRQAQEAPVDLLGPFGNGFSCRETCRNLLILADLTATPGGLALLLGLMEPMLDQGGRVTLLLRADAPLDETALAHLPLAVEVQTALDETAWESSLHVALPWADQVAGVLPHSRYAALAQTIREKRFRLEEGFCQVLVQADILCAVGACLACVVPTASGGVTRACVHGPVFDLTRLTS